MFISLHLPQLMAMVKSPKYRFPYSKGNGGLSAHKLHREDKIHLANKIVVDGCDSKKVSWEYCLRPDTLRGWVRKVKNGVQLHGNKGRPSALSKEGKEKLVEYCTAGVYDVKYEDFIKKIHELQMEDAASYKKGLSSVKLMARRSIGRLVKELNLKIGTGETTTLARADAIGSIRNAVSFAASMELFKNIKNDLVINMDATQYTVGKQARRKPVIYDPSVQKLKTNTCLKRLPEKGDSGLNMFIKFVYVITAGSRMADPVFLIADDTMGEDDFDAQECPCLSIGTALGSTAWVTFSKTRCWNITGYEWFNNIILLPFIQRIRSIYQLPHAERALFMLDGEPGQIKIYERQSMLEAHAEHNTDIVKPSGSTTEITQACDAGRDFMSSKAILKGLTDDSFIDSPLLKLVRMAFDRHDDY